MVILREMVMKKSSNDDESDRKFEGKKFKQKKKLKIVKVMMRHLPDDV